MTKKTCYVIGLIVLVAVGIGLGAWYLWMPKVIPPEVQKFSADWPTANQNYSNTRATSGSSINTSNISTLGQSWSLPITGVSEWGASTTNPIIVGDVAYFQDLKSNVYAVDFQSGNLKWRKDYNLDIAGPSGVAVGYDTIFVVKGHFEVAALDLQGKELWSTNLSNNQNVGIDIQPTVYDHTVYISTVPGVSNENFYKGGAVGVIYALDTKTGAIKWKFDTVDSADIWGNENVNSGGGAWYPPAIDTNSQKMFWGIANPAPWPGTKEFPNGTSRPGKNLYTNSLIALNHVDGKLKWYTQVLPHDLFDYDLQVSPILARLPVNGGQKDVVFGAGKMGKVFAFDRQTGEKLWETAVGTHLNDNLSVLPEGETEVSPGPLGGVETNMAYANEILYVPVVDMTVKYTPTAFDSSSFDLGKGTGELVAINARDGKILWTKKFPAINVGGATVVNDLVFTATIDGKIFAFNATTGDQVWQYQATGGINGWPAVKGDSLIIPVGLGGTPSLLCLKLGGKTTNPTNSAQPTGGAGKEFQQ